MRILSLFSGIGAFEKALKNIGIDYELVNYCEIDKFASKSYSLIHNENEDKNLRDVTKIDIERLPVNIDLITHGSPCQDYSIAGLQKGGDIGSATRSSLMWNSVEIIRHCRPRYVIWENVSNVLSKKHKHNFEKYLKYLEDIGYYNFYKILNSKDFNIPQNRKRIFVVSVLGGNINSFEFPKEKTLKKTVFDILDEVVDGKYYISIDRFAERNINNIENIENESVGDFRYDKGFRIRKNNLAPTLTCKIGSPSLSGNVLIFNKRIYDRYIEKTGDVNIRGVGNSPSSREYTGLKELAPTLCARDYKDPKIVKFVEQGLTIRKLTPKECFRLMGFDDKDYQVCKDNNISDTQLYKQAGNSIVVSVLEDIFRNLFFIN